ncbi:EcoKI restriction-modification system protein HsdS [Clostridium perfringens]|uniref:restriction endonuclease subunit S n=1 Tax=Clostridium perfringens TaxID=1502 RepID=UPI0024688169|nr:restriction endonuclease subunit S [Clostridium perfringens]MDH5074459.1 EcoKI restriction-modification system protein HsdS [Clostridium perfringens]
MSRNVPKLRFKGFEDEWKEYRLGDFLDFYSTNSLSRDCLNSEDGEVQNIHYGDIHMKFPTILDIQKYDLPFINSDIDISKIKDDSFCRDGDIVIADASENYDDIGKSIEVENISNNKVVAGLHTILCRDNKNMTANGFKGYMLSNEYIRKQIKVLAVGTKVLGISKTNLSTIKANMPSLQEQEKIANFLSKVDSIIEKQEKKVQYWNSYKKGMMQKIFSQKIRFKDENGRNYPEWEENKLEDYIMEYTEKTVIDNQYPVLTSSRKGLMLQSEYFKDRQVTTDSNIGYFVIPRGYITFRSRSDDGIFVFNQNNIIDKGIISYFYPVFNFNESINKYYALIYMNNYLKKEIFKEVVGTSQLVLSMSKLKKLKIKFPCLDEQIKIANFLSNIDNIIEKESNKLEELRQWKKGLLQQMFV